MAGKLGELVLGPMRLVSVYSAREALDKTEDRGGSRHLGYFLRKEDAEAISKGMGAMVGSSTQPSEHQMVTTDGVTGYLVASTVRVRVNTSVEDARRKLALSKLSDEDLQALGLTRD